MLSKNLYKYPPRGKAKFMNLKMNDRAIEHKPSTKLLGVHLMKC